MIAVDAYRRLQKAERLVDEKRAALNQALQELYKAGVDVLEYYRITEQL